MEHAKLDISLKMKNKKYLLDTNVLIDFMDGVPEVVDHVLHVGTKQCCISVISLHTLMVFGLTTSGHCLPQYHSRITSAKLIKII